MFLYIKYFPGKIDPTGTRIYGLGFGNGAGPKTSGGETAWEIYERWPE
jgi:predicted dienelactone hydrolase